MPYSIMLDAGHGGRDPGAVYNGRQEKDDTLKLTLAIGQILQNNGLDVEYTRTTLVYDKSGIKYEMAQNINEQLESIGFVNLGVKARPNLIVLRRTKMPAVLVEVGFINSDTDNQLFDDNFQDIAEAIASGILDTLESSSGGTVPGSGGTAGGAGGRYRVQVGAFRNQVYANNLLRELQEQEYPARIEDSNGFYRVVVGSYPTLQEAAQMEQRLKWAGYPTIVIH